MTPSADEHFMQRALDLGKRGRALASPNPMVGAVLVRDGEIVGEGFHRYAETKARRNLRFGASRRGCPGQCFVCDSRTVQPPGSHAALHRPIDRSQAYLVLSQR